MRYSLTLILVLATAILLPIFSATAEVIEVPADFQTIQSAINSSDNNDTIMVSSGEYFENINFGGNEIVLLGNPDDPTATIINGNEEGAVVTFDSDETETSVLAGFTIRNGNSLQGGGIYCRQSSPTLHHLIVEDNSTSSCGGGINIVGGEADISDVIVNNNYADGQGGGMHVGGDAEVSIRNAEFNDNSSSFVGANITCYTGNMTAEDIVIDGDLEASPMFGGGIYLRRTTSSFSNITITNCAATMGGGIYMSGANVALDHALIYGNEAEGSGGGIYQDASQGGTLSADHLTIVGNSAISTGGGGIYSTTPSINLTNSIVWGNECRDGAQVFVIWQGTSNFSYCDIQGGLQDFHVSHGHQVNWGNGNFDSNPRFIDSENYDFRLNSDSPCIDIGDPDYREDTDNTITDLGTFYYHHIYYTTTLFVNELQARNVNTIPDHQGEFDGWIELYNVGHQNVNLNNYYITDDLNDPDKCRLSEVAVIAPMDYFVLWADDDQGEIGFHLNFNLSEETGIVAIFEMYDDEFFLVDSMSYVRVDKGWSIGRDVDGGENIVAFSVPTPYMNNSTRGGSQTIIPLDYLQDQIWIPAENPVSDFDEYIPENYSLASPYPNPFNPTITSVVSLPETASLQVFVYNSLGQKVSSLANDQYPAGYRKFTFNAAGLSSGIYFIHASVPGKMNEMRQVVLMK
ncbi:MAG: T9SS type A sorting domain-containing protein [Candidatus Electryonea clarkiae]|nr:T9SS type A sorting domain-containing protein [Candidatus Electryonea clarkiae]